LVATWLFEPWFPGRPLAWPGAAHRGGNEAEAGGCSHGPALLSDIEHGFADLIDRDGWRHAHLGVGPAAAFPAQHEIGGGHKVAVAGCLCHSIAGTGSQQVLRTYQGRV
jgi:hypothetical protein